MATTLVWTNDATGVTDNQTGVVGDATNPAFNINKTGDLFALTSHVTGAENKGGVFASIALAKAHADLVIETEGVPQEGTVLGVDVE